MKKNKYQLSASLICADMLNLRAQIDLLNRAPTDLIHFDVMDGIFVPRYGLFPELLTMLKKITNIPIDVHLMVENVEPYIDLFRKNGADIIIPHVESHRHLHRTIQLIKQSGSKAGVALNPSTPIDVLNYIMDDIDLIMLSAINPGIVGHKLIPQIIQKIIDMKRKIGERNILIEIDGGVTFDSAPEMIKAGADILVCGTGTIFNQAEPLDVMINKLRNHLNNC